jgi:2-haloacid dehalogenase
MNADTKNYRALLFDLDNTLLDFTASENVGLEQLYIKFFKSHMQEKAFYDHYHDVNAALWQQVEQGVLTPGDVRQRRFLSLAETANDLCPDELGKFYEHHLGHSAPWIDGVEKTIHQLRESYQIGIVTNGFSLVQAVKYELSGLKNWCDCFVVSESVGLAKPDPRIFEMALMQLGAMAEHTLMVGDSLNSDYRGAMNADMDFCWVNPADNSLPADFEPPQLTVKTVVELSELLMNQPVPA